ncbi:MAG: M23 family metallopeptidase [Actinomycetota bacterium]|nr:M23 family metallopeptidase [Actinomycetota bacterium]
MSRRARSALALVLTLLALVLGGVSDARAQTAQPTQTPPTTVGLLEGLLGGLFSTTTTTAPAQPDAPPAEPPPPASSSGGAGGVSIDTTEPEQKTTERTIPPEAQRIINSIVRTGSNNNVALLEALGRLTEIGMSQEEAALVGMGQFPVAGEAWWSDDWYHPRFTPEFHFHEGTDIFAARGTPVRAPVDGLLEYSNGGAGGLGATVHEANGTYYYMCHLDSFARDLTTGSRVKQGQVVGFVGSSGNADGDAPHVHFEIHPGGGGPINPKPIIDRWVAEAIANVPKIIAPFFEGAGLSRAVTAAGLLRRLDVGSLGAPMSSDGPQLWASSVRQNGGIRLADLAGGEDAPPWDPRVRGAAARANDWRRADQLARNVLAPLTPPVLRGVLPGG